MSNQLASPTWTYTHISTATTTVIKSGAGNLHSLVINLPTAAAITIFDNTAASGTVIGIITPTATAGFGTYLYNVDFGTGLTILTAGTPDITVSWR